MIKKYLQIIIMLMIAVSASAQIPEIPKSMLSPNAASLGEYGEVPVSPFTGIPQIEIPLYEIKVGDFKMPITMSYHAGGVRPDQHPGWTGLGWTLNAGGCISRIVNCIEDDFDNSQVMHGGNAGYYFKYNFLNKNNWNTTNYLIESAKDFSFLDKAPDKFIFSFGSYQGYFYMNEKGCWVVKSDTSIKIEFNGQWSNESLSNWNIPNKTAKTFSGFTLTVEDGTQYIFGATNPSIEYSIDFNNQWGSKWTGTSWYLTKIITPNLTQITFSYEKDKFICQMFTSHNFANYHEYVNGVHTADTSPPQLEAADYHGSLIRPVYLSRISFPNGSIDFTREHTSELNYDAERIFRYNYDKSSKQKGYAPYLANYSPNHEIELLQDYLKNMKWCKLVKFTIYDNNDVADNREKIKDYIFEYNDNIDERLFLLRIKECNKGEYGKKYSFGYISPYLLPSYLSKQVDHWGFYNGINAIMMPEKHYGSRNPTASKLYYGILNKITYPTGGYSKFEFEPHQFGKYININRTACIDSTLFGTIGALSGGLRIKSIVSRADNNSTDSIKKTYIYENNYFGTGSRSPSGVLGGIAQYNFLSDKMYSIPHPKNYTIINHFSTISKLPVGTNSSGCHIGYSEVAEINGDGSFNVSKFSNWDNGYLDTIYDVSVLPNRAKFAPFSSKEQERGLLLSKEEYSSNSILKKKSIFEYEKDLNHSNYVRAIKSDYRQFWTTSANRDNYYIDGVAYRYYTYSMRKKKETIESFENGGNPMQNILTYAYNENKLLKETTKTINNDEILKVSYKYPDSYISYPSLNSACWDMYKAHRLSPIIESKSEIIKNGVSHVIGQTRYNYKSIYRPDSVEQAVGNNPYELRSKYKYDAKWNPIYIENDLTDKTVYVWGYNYQYLVAEVKNATLGEVESILGSINDFSSSQISNIDKLNKLRVLLPKALVTTYEYIPLVGLIKKIDTNGIHTFFEYDIMGRLILTKDSKGNVIDHYKYNYKQN